MTGATAPTRPAPTGLGPEPDRSAGGILAASGWALSMAVADRRNVLRLAVMAFGIGLCAFVLLALATISPLVDSMNDRTAASTPHLAAGTGSFETMPVTVRVDGAVVDGMVLRALDARPPAPPGSSTFPADGQILASPALAALLADPAGRTMRAVIAGTVVGVIDPKVLPGPHDLFFYQGSRTLTGGTAASTWGVPPGEHPLDPRVWSMLITGVVIVMVPLLLFTALAGRIGAARRDRRSATLRLLGASTGRLRLLIAGEALIAALAGVLIAAAAYLGARLIVRDLQIGGQGIQLADITPGAGWATAVLFGVPVLAVAATLTGFRGAALSPLGVLGRSRRGPRAGWRIVLLIAAVGAVLVAQSDHRAYDNSSVIAVLEICAVVALSLFTVAAMVGLVSDRIARRWVGGGVAGQLGRRRIVQDGSTTTRAAAALATVLAGFVVLMTVLAGTHYADQQARTAGPVTYGGSVTGLDSAEWTRLQSSLDSVPGVRSADVLGPLAGSTTVERPQLSMANCEAIRAMIADQQCRDGDSFQVSLPRQPPLPAGPYHLQFADNSTATWTPPADVRQLKPSAVGDQIGDLATDFVLTPGAVQQEFPGLLPRLPWMQVSLEMPKSSVDQVQQAVSWLGWRGYGIGAYSEADGIDSSPVPWIRAGLIGCGLLTLLICALGQALMGAEQISERRRAFALARASGVPLSVLGRSVLHAALLPVAVGVTLAAAAGALLAPYIQYLRGSMWMPPTWPWILLGSAAAAVVALLVAGGSILTLRATTGPGALRTE